MKTAAIVITGTFLCYLVLIMFLGISQLQPVKAQTNYDVQREQLQTLKEINRNLDRIADALENIDRKKQSSL